MNETAVPVDSEADESRQPTPLPNGVMRYPKGDVRRLFVLIAAVEKLGPVSLRALGDYTGQDPSAIHRDLRKINRELGVRIVHVEGGLKLVEWGDLLRPDAVRRRLSAEKHNISSVTKKSVDS